jgi:hypothetical protein
MLDGCAVWYDAWPPTADYHELGLGADGVLAAQPSAANTPAPSA